MKRWCALVLALLAAPGAVLAQDAGVERCDDPPLMRPETTFPSDSAVAVSIDAPLRVVYTPGYFGPLGPGAGGDATTLIAVSRCDTLVCDPFACEDGGAFVPGRVQILADELIFIPEGGTWDSGSTYAGIARGRDGDRNFTFCTGSSTDELAPVLGGIQEVTSDPVAPRCEAPDGGFRIGVFFAPATDTGPPGSIEYLLYQTRGVGVDSPILRDRVRNYPGAQITMAFNLPPEDASAPICLRVAAVDGVGNLAFGNRSDDGSDECIDPVQGNYFYGLCSAGARRSGPGPSLWLAAMGLVALLLTVRRRR